MGCNGLVYDHCRLHTCSCKPPRDHADREQLLRQFREVIGDGKGHVGSCDKSRKLNIRRQQVGRQLRRLRIHVG